ncbi:MAG: hypothetical protein JWO86_8424 [Myxococcaceae bacterium]|nr:hypothetical protein [Myxococcaceae bacterium]MEA2747021.1 hypothetical protein [Myxococcales bacterium]
MGLGRGDVVALPGENDRGAAPVESPLELELLELLPVVDFPQSHESDFELSLLESVWSHPVSVEPDDEELELDELDDELLELLDEEELELLEELELEELEEDELEVSVLLLAQLSPLVSWVLVSVPVVDVLPHPSSATVASSPVSS